MELGERTLITKGTLTGVVDRRVTKGLVPRTSDITDSRRQIVQLTKKRRNAGHQNFSASA
jgi:DNA-binding MarR family transcriptional regulator